MTTLWRMYTKFLIDYPIISRQLTACSLGLTCDTISQKLIEKKEKWDYIRALRFGSLSLIITPVSHKWFIFLDRKFGNRGFDLLKKVSVDQAVMGPCMNSFVLITLEVMNGSSGDRIWKKLTTKLPEIMVNIYKVWPLAAFVNFYFIPLELKILFVSCVAFFWNIYVSYTLQSAAAGNVLVEKQ